MIIKSLLDTDMYKFTMLQAYFHQYPDSMGYWQFKCRNEDVKLGYLKDEVLEELKSLKSLRITDDEASFLIGLGFFQEDFVSYMQKGFKLDLSNLIVENNDGDLFISISGKMLEVNLLEVYALSIVNELHFRHYCEDNNISRQNIVQKGYENLQKKLDLIKDTGVKFIDFGTRRRFCADWHDFVVGECRVRPNFIGTSNLHLAHKYNLDCYGTMAHEWICAHLGLVNNVKEAQRRALFVWAQEYGDKLGVALTDTFTTDAFISDLCSTLQNLYSGYRHDSGDPVEWARKIKKHCGNKAKTYIFSDGLNMSKALEIYNELNVEASHLDEGSNYNCVFGVGTNLTNDCGVKPLNIVMKLMRCNGKNLVKLSDNPGKTMGDEKVVEEVRSAYE